MILKIISTGSSSNSYILEANDGSMLLIEAGIKASDMERSIGYKPKNVAACVISHEHSDHFNAKTVDFLLKSGIKVYASKETFEAMGHKQMNNGECAPNELQWNDAGNGFYIMPFPVEHDAAQPYGYLVSHEEMGTLMFATDTSNIKYRFNGITHMMIEANYDNETIDGRLSDGKIDSFLYDRIVLSHLSFYNCKRYVMSSDMKSLRNIIMIHLSTDNGKADKFVKEMQEVSVCPVYVAKKGMEINLNLN
jgi:phosphoribosyl 1,2-cyclic phosphodiesterase